MPRVESTQPIAVKQAQLINPNNFRLDTSGAEVLGQIGGVLQELGKRDMEMKDRISTTNANAILKNAEDEYALSIIGKPLDEREKELAKINSKARAAIGQLKMSGQARKGIESQFDIWSQGFSSQASIQTIKDREKDAIIAVTTNYEQSYIDNGPDHPATKDAEQMLDAQFASSYADQPAMAQKAKIEATKRAKSAGEKNAVNDVYSAIQSATDIQTQSVIESIESEKEPAPPNFSAIKSIIRNDPRLSARTVTSLMDSLDAKSSAYIRDFNTAKKNMMKDEESRLQQGLIDRELDIADVKQSRKIDPATKRRLIDDYNNEVDADLKSAWALTDDYTAVDSFDSTVERIETGQIDISEGLAELNASAYTDGKPNVTKETFEKYRATIRDGGKDAVAKESSRFIDDARNVFVGRFTEREIRLKNRSLDRELTTAERMEARSVGFMIQVGKHQVSLFERELDLELRNRMEGEGKKGLRYISGDEANAVAAKLWEKYSKKTTEQRIQDFRNFSGSHVPRPENFSRTKWNELKPDGRATVVTALANGMKIDEVMELLAK